ncbi:DUF4185 domain-containing protein [Nocardia noduli]|uniref:DUF4185 domain-containing protein n=1 Tax=Nocardia noduli TaxID=2815722 RepID=UPI0027E0A7E9|nr:DUF4185 domain-containing protein [Nocardia noduli]
MSRTSDGGTLSMWSRAWVYVLSTGFQRDKGIILRRVREDRITEPDAYIGWGSRDGQWNWGNPPTPVLEHEPSAEKFGEMCVRPLRGSAWGEEGDGKVAQLYGPSIVPGSTLDDGLQLLVSQWKTDEGWPYRAMQFEVPVG